MELDPSPPAPEHCASPKWPSRAPYNLPSTNGSSDDEMEVVGEERKEFGSVNGQEEGTRSDETEAALPSRDPMQTRDSPPRSLRRRARGLAHEAEVLQTPELVSRQGALVLFFP